MRSLRTLAAAGAVAVGPRPGARAAALARRRHVAEGPVLHAVPGATVDVYANGEALLTDFKPGTLTDPMALPEGDLRPQGRRRRRRARREGRSSRPTASKVPAGANITVVAHLDEAGKPMLTPYVNDTSHVAAGQARLTVRHDAAAPAVDVRAGGDPVFTDLTNPNEDSADVPAGTVSADVVLAGTDTVAIGPADLDLKRGHDTIVYAWGSAEDEQPQARRPDHQRPARHPGGVPSGTGGLVDDSLPLPLAALTLLAAGGAAGRGPAGRRRPAALTDGPRPRSAPGPVPRRPRGPSPGPPWWFRTLSPAVRSRSVRDL